MPTEVNTLRVMRTCRDMGIKTVAVYSEADRKALFVRYADEAVCIGPPESSKSYLLGDKIIEVAKNLKADAIHPGYGFLSENAAFAQKVKESRPYIHWPFSRIYAHDGRQAIGQAYR